jgi:hypothetical protein
MSLPGTHSESKASANRPNYTSGCRAGRRDLGLVLRFRTLLRRRIRCDDKGERKGDARALPQQKEADIDFSQLAKLGAALCSLHC